MFDNTNDFLSSTPVMSQHNEDVISGLKNQNQALKSEIKANKCSYNRCV